MSWFLLLCHGVMGGGLFISHHAYLRNKTKIFRCEPHRFAKKGGNNHYEMLPHVVLGTRIHHIYHETTMSREYPKQHPVAMGTLCESIGSIIKLPK